MLFSCHDDDGQGYLAIAVDVTPGGDDLFAFTPLPEEVLTGVHRSEIALRDAVLTAGSNDVFIGRFGPIDKEDPIPANQLPDCWLPAEGYMVNGSDTATYHDTTAGSH